MVVASTQLSGEFNAFLRSALWLDRDETPLSVLSALARLDVDPWEEAAQLAALPQPSASAKLAAMLANLPGGPAIRHDLDAICLRSVSLLSCPEVPRIAGVPTTVNPSPRLSTFLVFALGSWLMALTLMTAHGPGKASQPAGAAAPAPPTSATAHR